MNGRTPKTDGNTIIWLRTNGVNTEIYKSENGGAPVLVSTNSETLSLNMGVNISGSTIAWSDIGGAKPNKVGISFCKQIPTPALAPVPTMSEWGLLLFGLLVLNIGLVILQKREQILS